MVIQTTQGNRLSCRDQEGRRGSDEAVPGPLVFPSRETRVSGNFWNHIKGAEFSHLKCENMARGSASWLSSHGRGLGPRDALAPLM